MPLFGEIVVIKRNGTDGTHFPLTATTCLFGRKAECDIRIQLPHVSKEHCKVEVKPNKEVIVINLSTVNPVQLNGHAVQQPVRLKHGDVLTIIDRSFRFEEVLRTARRRSSGKGVENQVTVNEQASNKNENKALVDTKANKGKRRSEGNVTKTTQKRSSLQISPYRRSPKDEKDQSPFSELYQMFKNTANSKQEVKTPVIPSGRSPQSLEKTEANQSEKSPTQTRRRSINQDHIENVDTTPVNNQKLTVNGRNKMNESISETSVSVKSKRVSSRLSGGTPKSLEIKKKAVNDEKRSPKKRKSGELEAVPEPPLKRKRVSFGGHLSPELFDKRLPPNSPLKKGATPARLSLSFIGSPLAVKRKSFGLKQSVIKETNEQTDLSGSDLRKDVATPSKRSPAKRSPAKGSPKTTPSTAVLTPNKMPVATSSKKSPAKTPVKKSPVKTAVTSAKNSSELVSPAKMSPSGKTSSAKITLTPGRRSPATPGKKSPAKNEMPASSSANTVTPVKISPIKVTPSKKLPAATLVKRSPAKHATPGRKSTGAVATPGKRSPAKDNVTEIYSVATPGRSPGNTVTPVKPVTQKEKSPIATPGRRSSATASPAKIASHIKSPGKPLTPGKRSPAKPVTPGKRSPAKPVTPRDTSPAVTPSKRSPAKLVASSKKSTAATPGKRSPAKPDTPEKKSPALTSDKRSPAKLVTPDKRSPAKLVASGTKSPYVTPHKRSSAKPVTPGKRSPVKPLTPEKKSPAFRPGKSSPAKLVTPDKRSPGKLVASGTKSPYVTAQKRSPAKPLTPEKKSPVRPGKTTPAKLVTPDKRSPGKLVASGTQSPSVTPQKRLPAKPVTPGKRSSAKLVTPEKKSPAVRPGKRSPARLVTPDKRSPGKLVASGKKSPSVTPGKRSPAKPVTPGKRLPAASPSKRSPAASPSKKSPGKLVASGKKFQSSTPSKRSPVKPVTPSKNKPAATPGKRSPAKRKTPEKRSPGKLVTPSKKSPVETPNKRSPGKLVIPGKQSTAETVTLSKKSPVTLAKIVTPDKSASTTPGRKTPGNISPAKQTPALTPGKRSLAKKSAVTPANKSATTPYTKGRFSISHVSTPPVIQTPKRSRKSLSLKTPLRRSRKIDQLEMIRSRRKSGATEANLLVAKSWADIVKFGAAKAPKKSEKKSEKRPGRNAKVVKKKTKKAKVVQTPVRKVKGVTSTGHADSPATIVIGRAHTTKVNVTGHIPKVVRNHAVKVSINHDESFTGMTELFSTPLSGKQRKSNRVTGHSMGTPDVKTPEESGEMVISPLNNSPVTAKTKRYNQDAVSRLLQTHNLPGSHGENENVLVSQSEEKARERSGNREKVDKSKTKEKRKTTDLTGIKRMMRTPKQKGKPVTDPVALKKMLRTPKQIESLPVMYTRRFSNGKDLVGIKRIMKTPKQKGEPVEDMTVIKRILRTPKQKGEPVEDMAGIKRIMRTPKQREQPVEDLVGIKRLMRTPREKGQPVDDHMGISQLMSTPTENTHPIEEIFGIKQLIKTPPKKSMVKESLVSSVSHTPEQGKSTSKSRKSETSKEMNVHRDGHEDEAMQDIIAQPSRRSKTTTNLSQKENQENSQEQSLVLTSLNISGNDRVTPTRKRGRPSKGSLSDSVNILKAGDIMKITRSPVSPKKTNTSTNKSPIKDPQSGHIDPPGKVPKTMEGNVDIVKSTPLKRRGRPTKNQSEKYTSEVQAFKEINAHIDGHEDEAMQDIITQPSRRSKTTPTNLSQKENHEDSQEQSLVLTSVNISGNDRTPTRKRGRPSKGSLSDSANILKAGEIMKTTRSPVSPKKINTSTKSTPIKNIQSGHIDPPVEVPKTMEGNVEKVKYTPLKRTGRPTKNQSEKATSEVQVLEKAVMFSEQLSETTITSSAIAAKKRRGRPKSPASVSGPSIDATENQNVTKSVQQEKRKTSRSRSTSQPKSTSKSPQKQTLEESGTTVQNAELQNLLISVIPGTDRTTPTRRGRPSKNIVSNVMESALKATENQNVAKPVQQEKRKTSRSRSTSQSKSTSKSPKKQNLEESGTTVQNAELQNLPLSVIPDIDKSTPTRRGRPSKNIVSNVTASALKGSLEQDLNVSNDISQAKLDEVKPSPGRTNSRKAAQIQKNTKNSKSYKTGQENNIGLFELNLEALPSKTQAVVQKETEKSAPSRRGRPQKNLPPFLPAEENTDLPKIIPDGLVNEMPKRRAARHANVELPKDVSHQSKRTVEQAGSEIKDSASGTKSVEKSAGAELAKKRTMIKGQKSPSKPKGLNASFSAAEEPFNDAVENLKQNENVPAIVEVSVKGPRSTRRQRERAPVTLMDAPLKKLRGRQSKNTGNEAVQKQALTPKKKKPVSQEIVSEVLQPVRRGRLARNVSTSEVINDESKTEKPSEKAAQDIVALETSIPVMKPQRGKRRNQKSEGTANPVKNAETADVPVMGVQEKRSTRGKKATTQGQNLASEISLDKNQEVTEVVSKRSTRGRALHQVKNMLTEADQAENITVTEKVESSTRGKKRVLQVENINAEKPARGRSKLQPTDFSLINSIVPVDKELDLLKKSSMVKSVQWHPLLTVQESTVVAQRARRGKNENTIAVQKETIIEELSVEKQNVSDRKRGNKKGAETQKHLDHSTTVRNYGNERETETVKSNVETPSKRNTGKRNLNSTSVKLPVDVPTESINVNLPNSRRWRRATNKNESQVAVHTEEYLSNNNRTSRSQILVETSDKLTVELSKNSKQILVLENDQTDETNKSRRGAKRKIAAEDALESVTGRKGRNTRTNTLQEEKAEKSPIKKSKTEAAANASEKGKSKSTEAKLVKETATEAVKKTRASTRARK